MTVILAVKCPGGAVIAADSQATVQEPQNLVMRIPTTKIFLLGSHLAYAGTGSVGLGQRINENLDGKTAELGRARNRRESAGVIFKVVNPIQKAAVSEAVGLVGGQVATWAGLFCGCDSSGAWIYEIDANGESQFHDLFVSKGSAYAVAHAAMVGVSHYDLATSSLESVKAIAYRAIESTCLSSGYGVELPVQLAVVTTSGIHLILSGSDEHKEIETFVNLWKSKEVETLGQLAPKTSTGATVLGEPDAGIDLSEI